jgi:hypothetical protein
MNENAGRAGRGAVAGHRPLEQGDTEGGGYELHLARNIQCNVESLVGALKLPEDDNGFQQSIESDDEDSIGNAPSQSHIWITAWARADS